MTALSTDIIPTNDLYPNGEQTTILQSNPLCYANPADFKDNIIKGADFWYYSIGANVIPAKSKMKQPNIPSWKQFQGNPVTKEQYEKWKQTGAFKDGIAVIAGKIWRGPHKDKHIVCIDCDNQKGVEEFLKYCFPEINTLEEFSKTTLVEQHLDNRAKAHLYFVVESPLKNRPAINGTKREKEESIPTIEVKSEGKSYVVCSPSFHKDGCRYEIIGTAIPKILDTNQSQILQDNLNQIYKRYGDAGNKNNGGKPSFDELCKDDFIASEGGRSNCLLSLMTSLLRRNKNKSQEDIKKDAYNWNQGHCVPPLSDDKVNYQWDCALKYFEKDRASLPNEEIGYIEKKINDSP